MLSRFLRSSESVTFVDFSRAPRSSYHHHVTIGCSSPYLETTHIRTQYDSNNNIVSVTETKTDVESFTDKATNAYEDFDRLISTNQRGQTINYSHDANGNRTSVSTPSGETTYTFDGHNRIATAATDEGTTVFTYTPDGKKQIVEYPNSSKIRYIYPQNKRIETIENEKPVVDTEISKFSYEYDKKGNNLEKNPGAIFMEPPGR